jgi:biotin-independent malonate decarboxylase gamma subunit
MKYQAGIRGRAWFKALTGVDTPQSGSPASVLSATADLGLRQTFLICVTRDPAGKFPCARDGQVGLEEAYALAALLRRVVAEDEVKPPAEKRPIIAIVDVKSQAYGRREETAGIFLSEAAAADAYATARLKGHAIIGLVVGHAISGGFLTQGYQANRLLAFDDAATVIQAMHEEAAARITRRSVEDLQRLGHDIPPMSYDIHDYARLGLLHQVLHVEHPDEPVTSEIEMVQRALTEAIEDCKGRSTDISVRWKNPEAAKMRKAGNAVRALIEREWQEA